MTPGLELQDCRESLQGDEKMKGADVIARLMHRKTDEKTQKDSWIEVGREMTALDRPPPTALSLQTHHPLLAAVSNPLGSSWYVRALGGWGCLQGAAKARVRTDSAGVPAGAR